MDLKDPADLRPSTTAFWKDEKNGSKRAFSIIASEEQAIQQMMTLLDKEGLVDGAAPDWVMVSNGMISRYHYEDSGKIRDFEFIDRYGNPLHLDDFGKHYSFQRTPLRQPPDARQLSGTISQFLKKGDILSSRGLKDWIESQLSTWDFNTYRWVLTEISDQIRKNSGLTASVDLAEINELYTYFVDHIRRMDTGDKAKSSLLDISRRIFYRWLESLTEQFPDEWVLVKYDHHSIPGVKKPAEQRLLIDATNFLPDGTDPRLSLAAFLAEAYDKGWRKYILYRVNGQRLISTAVMGTSDTDDVEMDVYGTPGEYFGAFMQGGTIRLHGNAQNFCAMCMHHGFLYVYGNAGKVCGYASKGGSVFILGDIVDRAWTNSVNDPRCQDLKIHILGSASKYCGESLMGGKFFFGGMYFDSRGKLRLQERPYRGTKLLGGASRGKMLFFDPYNRLDPHQYAHGKLENLSQRDWQPWKQMVFDTLQMAGIEVYEEAGESSFQADGKAFSITPQNFKLVVPKGGLKGYESH